MHGRSRFFFEGKALDKSLSFIIDVDALDTRPLDDKVNLLRRKEWREIDAGSSESKHFFIDS